MTLKTWPEVNKEEQCKLTVTNGQDQELQRAKTVGRLQHGKPVVPEGVRERRHDDDLRQIDAIVTIINGTFFLKNFALEMVGAAEIAKM